MKSYRRSKSIMWNPLNDKTMNLLEKIDEICAKSVTPERFEKVWGVSIEEHLDRLMEFVEEQKKLEEKR